MDWSNERYVRLYTRDTTTWKLLDWRARTVLLHILRKVDRAGVLDVGDDGVEGLAAVLELPLEVVEPGIAALTDPRRGVIVSNGRAYVMPNFIAAQEARSSDKQRQRDSRERRRAEAMQTAPEGSVYVAKAGSEWFRDDGSIASLAASHATSHAVTRCHTASPDVTPSLAEPSLAKPREKMSGKPDVLSLLPSEPAGPALHELIASACCEALNASTGSRYRPDAAETEKLARGLARAKYTVSQVRAVTEDRIRAWQGDPKMASYLRPGTILALANFGKYLDDLESRPADAPGAGRSAPAEPFRRLPKLA